MQLPLVLLVLVLYEDEINHVLENYLVLMANIVL